MPFTDLVIVKPRRKRNTDKIPMINRFERLSLILIERDKVPTNNSRDV